MGRKERNRVVLNDQVREFLKKKALTEEERSFVKRAYTGVGGLVGSQWDHGQFLTPEPITKFIIEMMGIQKGRILEPSVGAGAFLEHLPACCEVTGIEWLQEAAHVATVCYPDARIIRGDALETKFEEPFDYCVGNPPFGLTTSWPFSFAGKYKSEIAFIDYSLQNLKDWGILGMVVPDSILANQKEKPFRQWVMDNHTLLAVVSFPKETFYFTGTSVKTSLLMIQKGKSKIEDYSIFMAVAEKVGWDSRGNPIGSDLDEILKAYLSREGFHPTSSRQAEIIPLHMELEVIEKENGQYALAL